MAMSISLNAVSAPRESESEWDDRDRESEKVAAAATRCYQIPPFGCNARCKPLAESKGRPGHIAV